MGDRLSNLFTDATAPARLYGPPIGSATFKQQPDDFLVTERLSFMPSSEGEHCLVWAEKRDRNTSDVATDFAKALGIRKRLVSHCGLKDKSAVTRQWFSIHLPGKPSPTTAELAVPGVRVLQITRHTRKLHRGGHAGNQFSIRLRECEGSPEAVAKRWSQIARLGVPNYFGPQRFGRDGGNLPQAQRMFAGEAHVRDRALRGILISAARSCIFNACLADRIAKQTWDQPQHGDVFGFYNNRSIIQPHQFRGDEQERFRLGKLEITAPLWGAGELLSTHETRLREQTVAALFPVLAAGLAGLNLRQERRVIRLTPLNPELHWESTDILNIKFELPKGTYATTVLRELFDLRETRQSC